MKKFIAIVIVFTLTVSYAGVSYALPKPIDKLKGGMIDVVTSPKELKDYTLKEVKGSKFLPLALVGGLLKGTAYMGKQAVGGVVDIATFPLEMEK